MTKKCILALVALSSLSSLAYADYQIRIPIQHSINFNSATSGGGTGGGNNGGTGGSTGGGGLTFTDPDMS